jgi:hypothetical protein
MRIKIEHRKEAVTAKPRGLLDRFKTLPTTTYWYVDTTIELSQEERAILNTYNLWDRVLFNEKLAPPPYNPKASEAEQLIANVSDVDFTIADVFAKQPFERWFYSPNEAENFAHRMETEILPHLKRYIVQSDTSAKQNKTFEL